MRYLVPGSQFTYLGTNIGCFIECRCFLHNFNDCKNNAIECHKSFSRYFLIKYGEITKSTVNAKYRNENA